MDQTENQTSLSIIELGLLDSASNGFAGSLLFISAATVLFYDALLTLDEEWRYIWTSKWSPITCIFLLVRYLSQALLIAQVIADYAIVPSNTVCSVLKWAAGVGGIFLEAAADVYLLYRVFAVCQRKKYLLITLIVIYIGAQTASFSLVGILAPDYDEILNPLAQLRPILGGCIPLRYPFKITAVWIIFLCFQSILFACLFFQISYTWYQGMSLSSLFIVFVRDGIWAYFLIVVSLVICVISAYKAQSYGGSFITWLFTITSVSCCRLILNLRAAAHEPSSTNAQVQEDVSTFNAINPFTTTQSTLSTSTV